MLRKFLYSFGFRVTWMLPLKAGYVVSDILGVLNFLLARTSRNNLTQNLQAIFPDKPKKEIRRIVLKNYINFGRNLTELFRMHRTDKHTITSRIDMDSTSIIQKHRDLSSTVIIATAHFCNWELSAAVITEILGELHSIALPDPDPAIDSFYVRAREAIDNYTVPLNNASRLCLRLLKQNRPLAILADRSYTGEGMDMEFFGRQCTFPTGVARFALMADVPIIPYFIIRTGTGKFRALTYEPLDIPENGSRDDKIRDILRQYIDILEKLISSYPEFWFAFYPFWEESPPGAHKF
jgi:KDO2-lipid IV(A) lauroyltransferase